MGFEFSEGKVSIIDSPFQNATVLFDCGTFQLNSSDLTWSEKGMVNSTEVHGVEYVVDVSKSTLKFKISNNSNRPLPVNKIIVQFNPSAMRDALNTEEWMEYVNAFSFERISGVKRVGLGSKRIEPNPSSSMLYLLSRRDESGSILFSTLPPHQGDYIAFKALHDAPHCEGCFGLLLSIDLKVEIQSESSFETTSIVVEQGISPLILLENIGTKWRELENRTLKRKITGWNSWDYFSGAVRSKDIFDNLEACESRLDGRPSFFVIDEGYEPRWGAWVANWKFPEGLDGYCSKIKNAGKTPGIWTAPLLVNTYTDVYLNHPEWFARTADGGIATKAYSYGPMAFLDVTTEGGAEFLRETFRRLRSYGFEYFKVDFTQEVLNADSFHDKTVPRGGILRKAFSIIREVIGDEAYLLACGAPYESVTGLVDACRTTGDIHNFWGHVLGNAEAMAGKWWMQGTLWNNDPDFLIVRAPETCELQRLNREYNPKPLNKSAYWLAGREMNLREVRTYAQLIRFSGGDVFLSDDVQTLNDKGLEIIKKVLDNPVSAARPIDLFKRHDAIPEVWFSDSPAPALGVFNWDDDPKRVSVDLMELGIENLTISPFWGGEIFRVENGVLTVELKPRASAAFSFK